MKSGLGVLTLKNGFATDRRIDDGAPLGYFRITLGPFWVPKIGPKAHWINVEGVYAQSLISNTVYTVLKDFGLQPTFFLLPPFCSPSPPKMALKLISNREKIGSNDVEGVYAQSLISNTFLNSFEIFSG